MVAGLSSAIGHPTVRPIVAVLAISSLAFAGKIEARPDVAADAADAVERPVATDDDNGPSTLRGELERLVLSIDRIVAEMDEDLERLRREAALGGGAAARALERLRARRAALLGQRDDIEALLEGLADDHRR